MSDYPEPVIVGAVRTPIGKFLGTLSTTPAVRLGALAIKTVVERSGIEPGDVDETIMGNVLQAGQGQNVARQAAVYGGLPFESISYTVNKVCGSGLQSIMLAANAIKLGESNIIVAGGMENMSAAPYVLPKGRTGYRLGNGKLVDAMVHDGLWDFYHDVHMGNTGDIIAKRCNLTRETIDEFALASHQKAAKAQSEGYFDEELVPVEIKGRKGKVTVFDRDEGVRADSTLEGLARLRPVFKKLEDGGVTTAGNASQISDGAAAVVVTSREHAKARGLNILASIDSYTTAACEPEHVMYAPVPTVRKLWKMNGRGPADYDLFEHNEAFASASLGVAGELDILLEKLNVEGGAVALGHPIGCSGTRVLVTLLYALKRTGGHRGLAALCLGGGHAVAMDITV